MNHGVTLPVSAGPPPARDACMATHRYPPAALVRDYVMGGAGLALSVAPLTMLDLPMVTFWVLVLLSLCFAALGWGAARRHLTRVETDDEGVSFSPPRRRIAWGEVRRFALAYFSTRRDGARGWMELTLASGAATLRVDSRLERFDELVGRAWRAASRCGVEPDPTTRANLAALGLAAAGPCPGEGS